MNFLVPGFGDAPILTHKHYEALSTFTPENLLREARRQKGLPVGNVPAICVFDPDGDFVEYLHATGRAQHHPTWACYHTVLDTFVHGGGFCTQARTLDESSLYCLNFFSTLLSSTALVATVIELALMASAPTSGLSRMPRG